MTEEAVARVAAGQYGLFTLRQAVGAGLTPRQVEGGARRGRWRRVHRGVYRMAGVPVGDEQRLLAAVLAVGRARWRRTGARRGCGGWPSRSASR